MCGCCRVLVSAVACNHLHTARIVSEVSAQAVLGGGVVCVVDQTHMHVAHRSCCQHGSCVLQHTQQKGRGIVGCCMQSGVSMRCTASALCARLRLLWRFSHSCGYVGVDVADIGCELWTLKCVVCCFLCGCRPQNTPVVDWCRLQQRRCGEKAWRMCVSGVLMHLAHLMAAVDVCRGASACRLHLVVMWHGKLHCPACGLGPLKCWHSNVKNIEIR